MSEEGKEESKCVPQRCIGSFDGTFLYSRQRADDRCKSGRDIRKYKFNTD